MNFRPTLKKSAWSMRVSPSLAWRSSRAVSGPESRSTAASTRPRTVDSQLWVVVNSPVRLMSWVASVSKVRPFPLGVEYPAARLFNTGEHAGGEESGHDGTAHMAHASWTVSRWCTPCAQAQVAGPTRHNPG